MSKWISVFFPPTATPSSLSLSSSSSSTLMLLLLLWGTMYTGTAAHPSAFLLNALSVVADAATAVDAQPTSHISDYRQRPRSDSRADKPDSFPGFDAAGEVMRSGPLLTHAAASSSSSAAESSPPTSLFATQSSSPARERQRAANTEFYAQLVAKLIGNIGVGNILNGVERKHDKLQRLRRLKQLKADVIASAVRGGGNAFRPVSTSTRRGKEEFANDDDDDDGGGDGYNDDDAVVQVISATAPRAKQTATTTEKTSTTTTATPKPTPSPSYATRLADAFRVPAVLAIPASYVSSLWTNYMLPNQLRNTFGLADQSVVAGGRHHRDGPTQRNEQKPANTSATLQEEASHKNANIIAAAAAATTSAHSSSDGNGTRGGGGGETALNWLSSPLRGIWHSATKNLYVNRPNPIPTATRSIRITDERVQQQQQQQQHEQQQQQHHEFANDTGINVHNPSGMPIRQSASGAAAPTVEAKAPASPSSIDDGGNSGTNSTTAITRLARAKLAFLHAFYKYSQRMSTENENYSVSVSSSNTKNNTTTTTTSDAAGAAVAVTANIRAQTAKTASQLLASDEDVAAADGTFHADEFDANLNINDNVVAVGLAAERIAQLYGYRANNHAATAAASSTVHNKTTSTADGSNQAQRQNDQHQQQENHQRRRSRHERLRRVGERFIAGAGGAADTGGAQRRSFASPLATDRDNDGAADDAEDDVDADADVDNGSAGSTSSSSGGMVAEVAESVGIFVLEILGTIAGLSWGAFTYLQSLIYT